MKVFLRAFEPDDLKLINAWHNDEEINSQTGGSKYFVSSFYDKKWIEDKMLNNRDNVYCAICETESSEMIGYISLNNIDYRNGKADWGGIVLGNKSKRSKGYASFAAFLILKYGFEELGLNKITGYWLESNTASIMIGKLFGFKKEGILRKEVFKNGQFQDVTVMSILKEEYQTLKENFGWKL
jgi:[ribosomal protein S5]-alanine N-acetyltransferase